MLMKANDKIRIPLPDTMKGTVKFRFYQEKFHVYSERDDLSIDAALSNHRYITVIFFFTFAILRQNFPVLPRLASNL